MPSPATTSRPIGQEYLIETLGADGHWFIVGSERLSGDAQRYMRQYQRERPRDAFRVVEHPSRVLIVLHDPLTCEERAAVLTEGAA